MEPRTDASDTRGAPPGEGSGGMSVRFWGVRGSVPAPGPHTLRYGGNTSCVEIQAADQRIILDAGTGLRVLGQHLMGDDQGRHPQIFLTHFHWDHIQGFPFLPHLFDPAATLTVTGPRQDDQGVEALFAGQMSPVYFPVPYDTLAARSEFRELNGGEAQVGPVTVSAMRVRHPSFTLGFRVDWNGRTVCYLPDNELAGGSYDIDPGWRDRLIRFVAGADLLLHDAMYTDEEYGPREGWGHSTFGQALDLGVEAGVKRLYFFHHAPDRSDDELDRIVARYREEAAKRAAALELDAATEGRELLL